MLMFCVAVVELVELIEFTRSTFLQHVSKAKAAKLVRTLIDLFLDMEAGSGREVRIKHAVTSHYGAGFRASYVAYHIHSSLMILC